MATLKGQTIATSYQDLVKRADTYSQTGTNIEIMDDSGDIQATGLYLESGATTSNVGIGVAAPDVLLHLMSTTSDKPTLRIQNISGDADDDGGNIIFTTSDGAIGSVTDLTDDDVLGDIVFQGVESDDSKNSAAMIRARINGTPGANDMPGELAFYTNEGGTSLSQQMCILANGNVGIGVTAPGSPLTVKSSSDAYQGGIALSNTAGSNLGYIWMDGSVMNISGDGSPVGLTITDAGYVGIGASTPAGTLHLYSESNSDPDLLIDSVLSAGEHGGNIFFRTRESDGDYFLNDGTEIGDILFQSYDNTDGDYIKSAKITCHARSGQANNELSASLSFYTNDNSDDVTERMRITETGYVGIGTTSPDRRFHIMESDASLAPQNVNSTLILEENSHTYMEIMTPNDKVGGIIFSDGAQDGWLSYDHDTRKMQFATGATAAQMTIDSSGKVGIGTAAPNAILHVNNETASAWGSGQPPTVGIQATSPVISMFDDNAGGEDVWHIHCHDQKLQIHHSDHSADTTDWGYDQRTTIATFTTTGLGIGTTSPDELLEVEGTGDPDLVSQVKATALTDTDYAIFRCRGTDGSTESVAELGVVYNASPSGGTDAPACYLRLETSSGTANRLWFDDSNQLRFSSTFNDIGSTGGTLIGTQTSDERLKNISSDAFPYGLDKVNQMTPIQYSFKDDKASVDRLGFGAQTMKSIIPESVYDTGNCIDGYREETETVTRDGVEYERDVDIPNSDDPNTKLAMEYVQLVPVLVKAIQELSAKVTALENA